MVYKGNTVFELVDCMSTIYGSFSCPGNTSLDDVSGMDSVIKLSSAPVNTMVSIYKIVGSDDFRGRIYSLGLCSREELVVESRTMIFGVVKIAILNKPEIIRIALRKREADMILVKLDNYNQWVMSE